MLFRFPSFFHTDALLAHSQQTLATGASIQRPESKLTSCHLEEGGVRTRVRTVGWSVPHSTRDTTPVLTGASISSHHRQIFSTVPNSPQDQRQGSMNVLVSQQHSEEGVMLYVAMSEPRRHRPASPRQPGNNNVLWNIFLLLPSLPLSLLRAFAVCKPQLHLISDPTFHHHFHDHHRIPPLLGFFGDGPFISTMDPPSRIPSSQLKIKQPLCKRGSQVTHFKGHRRRGLLASPNLRLRCEPIGDAKNLRLL